MLNRFYSARNQSRAPKVGAPRRRKFAPFMLTLLATFSLVASGLVGGGVSISPAHAAGEPSQTGGWTLYTNALPGLLVPGQVAKVVHNWLNSPTSFNYVWKYKALGSSTEVEFGASADEVTVPVAAAGGRVTVTITATNSAGSAVGSIGNDVTRLRPVNTVAPVLSGTAQVGKTLTVSNTGTWDDKGFEITNYTYKWGVWSGSTLEGYIDGATAKSFTIPTTISYTTLNPQSSKTIEAVNANIVAEVSAESIQGPGRKSTAPIAISAAGSEQPASNVALTLNATVGQLITDATVDFSAEGLKPASAWDIILRSEPQLLKEGFADSDGLIDTTQLNIPPGLSPGWHSLTLSAVNADGSERKAVVWFLIDADGRFVRQQSTQPADELATTGSQMSTVSMAALIALLAGAGVFSGARVARARRDQARA